MKTYLERCTCGSGKEADAEFDARGIFLCYACPKCRKGKLAGYRSDVLTDPQYPTSEPVDEE